MSTAARPALRHRRAARVIAPAVGLVAAGLLVWQGSSAAFQATTTSPGDAWTAGSITLNSNTGPANSFVASGNARFVVTGIVPGQQQQRCVTVRSLGTLPGSVKWYATGVTGTGLQSQLRIRVQRALLPDGTGAGTSVPAGCAGFPAAGVTTVFNDFLPAAPGSYAAASGPWAVPGGVTSNAVYRIRWTFVSTGTNAGDNLLQGTSATASFNWDMQ